MRKFSRGTALLASAAALSMIATPALARDRWGGWGGRHHHDGIDAGDVIAGVLILGGIAAIASAASNSNKQKQQREREYRYPDDNGTYGGGYERPQDAGYGNDTRPQWNQEASGGINAAVGRCMDEVQRGDTRVESVDSVNRDGQGYRVQGQVDGGSSFSCLVDADGRIRSVSIDGRAL